jgi:hypothetical protein
MHPMFAELFLTEHADEPAGPRRRAARRARRARVLVRRGAR